MQAAAGALGKALLVQAVPVAAGEVEVVLQHQVEQFLEQQTQAEVVEAVVLPLALVALE
jgi:hypothetical protein